MLAFQASAVPTWLRGSNRTISFGGILSLAMLFLTGSFAANADSFLLGRRPIEIAENGIFMETVLSTTNTELSFMAPKGWTMTVQSNQTSVSWLWQDFSSIITLRLVPDAHGPLSAALPPAGRQEILARFPGATINHEFVCYTRREQGRAFDLETAVNGGFVRATRLACVPFRGGLVEVDLTCPPELFTRHHRELTELLNSFRILERHPR